MKQLKQLVNQVTFLASSKVNLLQTAQFQYWNGLCVVCCGHLLKVKAWSRGLAHEAVKTPSQPGNVFSFQ